MNHTYRDDLYHTWLLALQQEFQKLRYRYPPLARYRPPHFGIDAELSTTLGTWDPVSRRITLAACLFETCVWEQVVAILKHELAHKMVSDLGWGAGEPPHGPAFREACRLIECDPIAKQQLPWSPHGTHPVISRIHKLLALSESPNRHEAEAALSKAHELMLKYNVDQMDGGKPGTYAFRFVAPLHLRTPIYIWSITNILSDFYFVDFISRPYTGDDGRSRRAIELYGTPANLDMAEYVYYFLLQQADCQWEQHKRSMRLKGNQQRLSFLRGLYAGVHSRLSGERSRLASEKALVWIGDPDLKAFFRQRNPNVRLLKRGSRIDPDAHAAGHAAGEALRIRQGIERGSHGQVRQLQS